MDRRVVITGMAIVAPNGIGIDQVRESLRTAQTGIKKNELFDTSHLMSDQFGVIAKDYPYEVTKRGQVSRLESIHQTLVVQLFDAGFIDRDTIGTLGRRAGFSFATSVGSHDFLMAHKKKNIPLSIANSNLYKLANDFAVEGPVLVNSSACAAGSTSIATAFSYILSGKVDLMIAGGIDPLTEFSSYGFNSLQNISKGPCQPFDRNRSGITLGEGGAYLVLEDYQHAKARAAKIIAELLGYGLGNDAYHPTSPDPTGGGALRVMKQAIKQSQLDENKIGYINAHGTGTSLNDAMEFKAVNQIDSQLFLSSTKSYTGHALAAAGALEAVFTIIALQEQISLANLGLDEPEFISDTVNINAQVEDLAIDYALSNSFAFGGNSCSLLIGRTDG